jgi:1,4-dihydroxy-2-naphthoate octaprenyltransferase
LLSVLWASAPYAVQVAALATNIIVVNNLRDRHTDVEANKKTLAVRFGATFCRVEYFLNILLAYGLLVWEAFFVHPNETSTFPPDGNKLIPLLSFPLAWKEWQALYTKEGGSLNPHVGGAAKVQLLFCILLAISIRMSH